MPKTNTTIDDNSPLITYLPADSWSYGSRATDDYASNYYGGGTFTVSNTTGATATFKFNGTGVWIYGAKRPNHGTYAVTLDGQKSATFFGNTSDGRGLGPGGNEFQALLFDAPDLTSGSHEVVLTNTGTILGEKFFDIDFITWESNIGPDGSTMSPSSLPASMNSSVFKISGRGWENAYENSELQSSAGLYTNEAGDSVEITFELTLFIRVTGICFTSLVLPRTGIHHITGDVVEMYGSIGVSCGTFDVGIDGGASTTYNASRHQNLTNQLLFYGANLGSGQHTLKVTNSQTSPGALVIDHAQTYEAAVTVSLTVSPAVSSTVNATITSSSRGGVNKALIGGLCGALGFILVVLVILYMWVRRRRRMTIASKQTVTSKLEAFDIDQAPPPASVLVRQTVLPGFLRDRENGIIIHESQSDVSKSSRKSASSTKSHTHSQKTLDLTASSEMGNNANKVDKHSKGTRAHSPRRARDEHLSRNASSSRPPYDIPSGKPSSKRLPHDNSGRNALSGKLPKSIPHDGHNRSRQHQPRDSPVQKTSRPLPIPRASSSKDVAINFMRGASIPPISHQPQRSTNMLKGRRRSARNSRLIRTGYNILFAQPGSSNSGSAYAPSTVLTSEISERPTTTLSPVTEAPPPLPPSRSQTPQPSRTLQIVNQVEEK